MAEENNDFVNLMLDKASKKDEPEPVKMLSPEKDPETLPQRSVSDDDIKDVEEFTENLKKRLQTGNPGSSSDD